MKSLQEMYLNTYTSLAVDSTPFRRYSPTSSSVTSESGLFSPVSISSYNSQPENRSSSGIGMTINDFSALHQQHLLGVRQQHLAGADVAEHHLGITYTVGNQRASEVQNAISGSPAGSHEDEISKSLKMFAMSTAYSNSTGSSQFSPPPLDAVMQDFASNGYICDELNRLQLGTQLSNNPMFVGVNTLNLFNSNGQKLIDNGFSTSTTESAFAVAGNSGLSEQQLHQFQHPNIDLNYNNSFVKMIRTHPNQHSSAFTAAAPSAVTATAAAAVNIHYNCSPKKLPKRYVNKNEKYATAKRCVFCDNNNQPKAVVNSHAVRDSWGRVLCPILRIYICPICKASGDYAHTIKYCPEKPIITMEDAIKGESFRLTKGTFYNNK